MRPPKKDGQATTVFFHVTVMGLDSIDETSMVFFFFFFKQLILTMNVLKFSLIFNLLDLCC